MTTKIDEAVAHTALALGYPYLKEKQFEVVGNFVSGNDVFGVLPTGYGWYECLHATFDHLSQVHSSIYLYPVTSG